MDNGQGSLAMMQINASLAELHQKMDRLLGGIAGTQKMIHSMLGVSMMTQASIQACIDILLEDYQNQEVQARFQELCELNGLNVNVAPDDEDQEEPPSNIELP